MTQKKTKRPIEIQVLTKDLKFYKIRCLQEKKSNTVS